MDLGKDGTANVTKCGLKVLQSNKNPLVNNKGFNNHPPKVSLKQKLACFTDQESTIPTLRLDKPMDMSVAYFKRYRIKNVELASGLVDYYISFTEAEEVKARSPPARIDARFHAWAKLTQSQLHKEDLDDVEPEPEEESAYLRTKSKISLSDCITSVFQDKLYQADIISNTEQLPQYTLKAYQYRLEAFTPEIRDKYAKDNKLYSGILKLKANLL